MNKTQKAILAIALVALTAVCLAIFGPMLLAPKSVRAPLPERNAVTKAASAKGVVESEHEAILSWQIPGRISSILVAEGDKVNKGQLLATLDSAKSAAQLKRAEAALDEARERLKERQSGSRSEDIAISGSVVNRLTTIFDKAREDYERQQRLYAKDATTRVELDRAEEKMKVAQDQLQEAQQSRQKVQSGSRSEEIAQARADVARAAAEVEFIRAQLDDSSLRAPFSGQIVDKLKELGETVDVGKPALRIIDPSVLRVRAELEESDIGSIREGETVEATTDSLPGKVFSGRVVKLLPAVKKRALKSFDPLASYDMSSQEIYISLKDYTGLKSGMSVTVKFHK